MKALFYGSLTVAALIATPTTAGVRVVTPEQLGLKVAAQTQRAVQPAERWTATRAIVRDATTGELRRPTPQETLALVKTLREMTAGAQQPLKTVTTNANGMAIAEVDESYQSVVIARPAPGGVMETRCVRTFEEAAEFLGLTANNSVRAKE